MSNWAAEVEARMAAAETPFETTNSRLRREREARATLRAAAKALKAGGLNPVQILAAFAVVAGEIATQEV